MIFQPSKALWTASLLKCAIEINLPLPKVQKHYTHKGKDTVKNLSGSRVHPEKLQLQLQNTFSSPADKPHHCCSVFFDSSVSRTVFSDAIRLLWIESQLNLLSSLSTSLLYKIKALLWTFLDQKRVTKCKSTSRIPSALRRLLDEDPFLNGSFNLTVLLGPYFKDFQERVYLQEPSLKGELTF